MDLNGYDKLAIRKSFAENSRHFEINLNEKINVSCPVKLFHGVEDQSVPYKVSKI